MLVPLTCYLLGILLVAFAYVEGHFLPGLTRPGSVGVDIPHPDRKRIPRSAQDSRVQEVPLEQVTVNTAELVEQLGVDHPLVKRFGYTGVYNYYGIAYIIQIGLGTPPQYVGLFLDTGSWDMFVNPSCEYSADEDVCNLFGQYNGSLSSTVVHTVLTQVIFYGTGKMRGWVKADVAEFAGASMGQVRFIESNLSTYLWAGVMGMGYSRPYNTDYDNIVNMYWKQGFIDAPIFSVGLGTADTQTAAVVFGGVDRWKYIGTLEPVPLWPQPVENVTVYYKVNITGLGITRFGVGSEVWTEPGYQENVLVDVASTYSYLDEKYVAIIGKEMNAVIDDQGIYHVDCALRNTSLDTIDFFFNNGNVRIPLTYNDFIIPQGSGCHLGVQPSTAGGPGMTLGVTFCRGAYLVFDQRDHCIWMAPWWACGPAGIVDLKTASLPEVTGICRGDRD